MMRRWVKKRSKHMLKLNKLMKSSETENRYFVRVMIVGKESAGKTCLMRRLLNEGISDVSSTDGVDIIVRRCKINIEDGKWTIGNEIDDKNERINRALSSNEKTKIDATEGSNRKKYPAKSIPFGEKESNASVITSNDFPIYIAPEGSAEEKATQILQEDETNNRTISHFDEISSDKIHRTTETKENLDKNEPSLLLMPENLMSEVFSKSTVKTQRNLYALCELWDFAGQKEFYATHQAFLTSSAVYLVVADMENDIIKQDKSQFSADFQHIGDYIDFWFDSIHCHRTVDERASHGHFDPPILLVFTGKDKYNKTKTSVNNWRKRTYFGPSHYECAMLNIFGTPSHPVTVEVDTDKEFENFRFAIFDTARKKNNWGKAVPLKWFLLEHLIQINKKNGKNFISFTDMFQLAKHPDIKILEEEDLLLFLRFQHNVGNIIFFESIPDLIILNPQWLADAFRCLVSDRVDTSSLHHLTDWTLFKRQGKISESLITELFHSKDGSQFSGQKYNLHKVMEKFDILVKIENSNYYIMPSEMPSSTLNVVCEKFGILTKKCKRTSWLCFKFEFLPRSFFNHLSAWFIRKYDPSKLDVAIALYRGICMFDIESSGCKKILVTMSTDTL
ncbi:Hypothetical predicted protein [Mytilus galloprovincialis]|uniref:COR domain-containing protein n=1 Tax=Mytilus galloprovincialis TaxID=29158 RepID=A0A8B6E3S1_MYTGA|nr:Hypothetical predicted protein [Mytilus galloprovincialis]